MKKAKEQIRDFCIQTFSGKIFDYLESPEEQSKVVDIEDIAHSLSLQCRYSGHVSRFYSVAEHCIHISNSVTKENSLLGLLHDGAEAYVSDIPGPLKDALCIEEEYGFVDFEEFVLEAIVLKYTNLDKEEIRDFVNKAEPDEVWKCDRKILLNEKEKLFYNQDIDWGIENKIPNLKIECWSPKEAEGKFLERFYKLTGD